MATLFQTSDAPANFGSANTPINVGMAFFVSSAANLVGIRFYKSASDPLTSHTVSLWDVSTHANLAQQASSGETASGWQEVTLTTPVALTPNKAYRVSLFTPAPSGNAFYCYSSGYFTAAKTNGIITAYASGTVPSANEPNNTYDFNNTADYPASDSGVQANYWVDVNISTTPGTLHFPMAIADTSTVVALTFHGATGITFGHNYATAFPLTESPISEGGKWQGGLAVGLDWNNIRSTPAFAYGNQDGIHGSTYADSTAILIGAWGPNQTVQGMIRVKAATNVVNVFEEVALRLRSTMAAHSCTGYECLISVSTEPTDGNYVQIVRWNGAIGSFTELNGASFHAVDGDILKATIVGSVITVFKNGTQVLTATDSTYTSGNPGVGHFLQNSPEAAVSPSDYGWQNWSATDGTPMRFPLVVADTSTVLALGFHQAVATLHFPLTVADTSTVLALGFHTGAHLPLQVADTSTVLKLGFEAYVRFPLVLDDVSTVLALGFHQNTPPLPPHFPVVVADTSTVLAIGFTQNSPLRFPMHMADTSSVLALGYRTTRRFGLAIADTSTVLSLSFNQFKPTFPLLVTSTSTVLALGFENDHYTPQIPLVVPPYAGEDQPSPLEIPLWIQYKEDQWEEGPWVMPPYALIFPQDPIPQPCERGYDAVHHEWLKTHPRSTGPARAGSRNHRPQSVLAPYVPAQPIMKRSSLCTPYLPTLARTSNNKS